MYSISGLEYETEDTESYSYRIDNLLRSSKEKFESTQECDWIPFVSCYTVRDNLFKGLKIELPKCWIKNEEQFKKKIMDLKEYVYEVFKALEHDDTTKIGKLAYNMGVMSILEYTSLDEFFEDIASTKNGSESALTDSIQRIVFASINELAVVKKFLKALDTNDYNLFASVVRQLDVSEGIIYGDNGNNYESYCLEIIMTLVNFTQSEEIFENQYNKALLDASKDFITLIEGCVNDG